MNLCQKLLSARKILIMNRCPICSRLKIMKSLSTSTSYYRIPLTALFLNHSTNFFTDLNAKSKRSNKDLEDVMKVKQTDFSLGFHCNYINTYIKPSKILQHSKLCSTGKTLYRHYATSTNTKTDNKSYLRNQIVKINDWSWKRKAFIAVAVLVSGVVYKIYSERDDEIITVTIERNPKSSEEIPDNVQYLLIGGGTAAFSACRAIKSKDPTAHILVLSKEPYYPYMKPPLSKELFLMEDREKVENLHFEQWNGQKRSLFYEPDEFFLSCTELNNSEFGGIAVARGWSAIAIDPLKKVVTLDDGKKLIYDKCLLATGSSPLEYPLIKKLPNKIKKHITYFHTLNDFYEVENVIKNGAKSIAVYGNGLLACELVCSLKKRGKQNDVKVTQIVQTSNVMEDILPPYLCNWVNKKISEQDIKFIKDATIKDVSLRKRQLDIKLSNGSKVQADHLLICTEAVPNTSIAESSGLEVDPINGGFVVNAELEARSHVFAAGDCASYYDYVLGRRRLLYQYDHAIASGRLAGENMTGAGKPLTHQAMFWTDIGADVGFEAIGNVSAKLQTVAIFLIGDNIPVLLDDKSKFFHKKNNELNKGIVFYLNKDRIVEGILLWNIYNRVQTANQVIKERRAFDDMVEVAKLFEIHKN